MGLSFLAMGALLPQQGGFCWRRGYSTRPYASARCPINTAVLFHRVKVAGDTIPDIVLRIGLSILTKFIATYFKNCDNSKLRLE